MKAKIERAWIEVVPDSEADVSYLYQDEFAERREAWERDEFGFVGVRACVEIRFETEQGGWQSGPIVSTPGLWSIEDDSGESYLKEVGAEEAAQLPDMLEALGISRDRAKYAERMAVIELKYK